MRIIYLLYTYVILDSQGVVLLPAPENITIDSNNFNHILHWSPGHDTPFGTIYILRIDEKWQCNTSDTSINISKYMHKIYNVHILQLWASLGNRSSLRKNISFVPYESTVIGPPSLTLSGCGDCLNINISLPKTVEIPEKGTSSFYNNIHFDIHWRKAGDEKISCHEPKGKQQSLTITSSVYIIQHLQPGEQYCVQAQPKSNTISHSLTSCWTCEFTSKVQPRGVAFLTSCIVAFVVLGLFVLVSGFILNYTGYLCKPKSKIPKALTAFVAGYFLSPEELQVTVAEAEINKPHQLHGQKEKEHFHMQNESDEDEHGEEESHCGYMDQAAYFRNLQTGNGSSISSCSNAENSGGCCFRDTSTGSEETALLSQHQHDLVNAPVRAPWPVAMRENLNSFKPEKLLSEKLIKDIEPKTEQVECFRNVNLKSVTLKSMHPEEENLCLVEEQDDTISALEPQIGNSISTELHTECDQSDLQTELRDRQSDQSGFSDASECDCTSAGYMLKHRDTTENNFEEASYSSYYMTR